MQRVTLWVHEPEQIYPIYQCFKQARIRNEYIYLLLKYQIPEAGQMRLDNRMNSFLEDESLNLVGGLHGVRIPASNIMIASGAAINSDRVASGLATWLSAMLQLSSEDSRSQSIEQALAQGSFLFIFDISPEQRPLLQAQLRQTQPTVQLTLEAPAQEELTG